MTRKKKTNRKPKRRTAMAGVRPTTPRPDDLPIITPFGMLTTPFSEDAGSGFAPPTDEELIDDQAPAGFIGGIAEDSGLEISDEDLREDAQDQPVVDQDGPLDAEDAARAWLAVRTKIKARRIAGLADDAAIDAQEQAAFERLKTALEADR